MSVEVEGGGGVEIGRESEAVGVALVGLGQRGTANSAQDIRDGYRYNLGYNFIINSRRSDGCGRLAMTAMAHRCA